MIQAKSAAAMPAGAPIQSAPVRRTSGPTTCQQVSTRVMACVISTLPSSPTGDGARTPPIYRKVGM